MATQESYIVINYIEVAVGSASGSTFSSPIINSALPAKARSTVERLRELEEIKTFISEQEYEQKREAILAAV